MWPILFEIPHTSIKVFGFGAMMVLALWAALGLATWRARREGLDPETLSDMSFWIIIAGLVGARLFYVLEYWGAERMNTLLDVIAVWKGGIVLYGSLLGAAAGFLLYRLLRPFPILPTLDVIAPSMAVGIAFGRIGCFVNGCCFGDRCTLPWAVRFPKGSPPWEHEVYQGVISKAAAQSLPLHPTQLYSALDGFLLLWLLSAYYPQRKRDGEVMALLLVAYPITRFLIEILRDDESVFLSGLTISQAISVVLFAIGLGMWAWLSRRPAVRYADRVVEADPTAE